MSWSLLSVVSWVKAAPSRNAAALAERLVDLEVQQLVLGVEVGMVDIFGELEPSVERDLRGRGVALQVQRRGGDETDGLDLPVPAQQQVVAVEHRLGDVGLKLPLLGGSTRSPQRRWPHR